MSEGKTNDDIFKFLEILNENNKRIEDRLQRIETSLCKEINNVQERVQALETENSKLKSKLHDLQKYRKKFNLVIYGIKEEEADLKIGIEDVIRSKLDVPFDISEIRDLYRLGKPKENSKPRPILIELTSYTKKLNILKKSSLLKGSGIYINSDLTEQEQEERKILTTHLRQAREKHYNAKIQRNKLIINGEVYGIEELLKNDDQTPSSSEYQDMTSKIIEAKSAPSTPLNKNQKSTEAIRDSPNSVSKAENAGRNLRSNLYCSKGADKKRPNPNTEEKEQKESKKKKN